MFGKPTLTHRFVLLVIGLAVVHAAVYLLGATTLTAAVTADQDLSRYWRTTYDILVRPPASRSPIETAFGLVQANHLSGLSGGITFEQYAMIKALPGVEIAAPVAMLGFIPPERMVFAEFDRLTTPGAYKIVVSLLIDDGVQVRPQEYRFQYYYVGEDAASEGSAAYGPILPIAPSFPFPPLGEVEIPLLLAAIDPPQERALVGLDQALIRGRLPGSGPVHTYTVDFPEGNEDVAALPVLINATPYVRLRLRAELTRLILPPDTTTYDAITARGGVAYLDTLPAETIAVVEQDSGAAYQRLLDELAPVDAREQLRNITYRNRTGVLGPITYRETTAPFPHAGVVLEAAPLPQASHVADPAYRRAIHPNSPEAPRTRMHFMIQGTGVFDIERLPGVADVNRVPLETYYPPRAVLRYDDAGQPVAPRPLFPTLALSGYLQPPPLLLTTLEAARTLRGDACISAIRVRVAGIDRLDAAAQAKIEAIASEIQRRTGLEVDIMVGSSPQRILVRLPGLGYVEEYWVRKNINTAIGVTINRLAAALLTVVGVVGVLFTLNTTLITALGRQRDLGLLQALGWRQRTICWGLLRDVLLAGALGGGAGTGLALVIAAAVQLPISWSIAFLTLAVGLSLALLGGALPAWRTARRPPLAALHLGQVRAVSIGNARQAGGYALYSLLRRPARTVMVLLTQGLSSGLTTLILLAVVETQGYLTGTLTLLGEYILHRIEVHHVLIAALSVALSAAMLGDQVALALREQAWEVGMLKALGWRTADVAWAFVRQAVWLGALGGGAGVLLAASVFGALNARLPLTLIWIAPLGIGLSVAVSLLAAAAPAWRAARQPPLALLQSVERER